MADTQTIRQGPFGHRLPAVEASCAADVSAAVERARAAQRQWAARPVGERAEVLLRFGDLVLERRSELLDQIQIESGKSRVDAYEEIADIASVARHYARRAAGYLRPRAYRGLVPGLIGVQVHRDPVGVVGVIGPWNFPLLLTVGELLPALVAGNGVVVKPDPLTPLTCRLGVRLLAEAGLPDALLAQVDGGAEVGQALIDEVDHIIFTGSTPAGRAVARQAADRLIGATLELGGKNSLYVRPDADLRVAVPGAIRNTFANAGQVCLGTERLVLHRAVAGRFVDGFVAATRALTLGNTLDFGYQMGSQISAVQHDKVRDHLRDAQSHGATVLVGGADQPDLGPYFIEPTVLADVPTTARCYREETFGPLVSVYVVDSDDEALDLIADTDTGLTASVWTGDVAAGRAFARRIPTGSVAINEQYQGVWGSTAAPFGGVGASGSGRRHGPAGVAAVTQTQTLANQRGARFGFGLSTIQSLPGEQWTGWYTHALKLLRRSGLS